MKTAPIQSILHQSTLFRSALLPSMLLIVSASLIGCGSLETINQHQSPRIVTEDSTNNSQRSQTLTVKEAQSDESVNHITEALAQLPEPARKSVVAVYQFSDKTGQHQSAGLSKVVTQGGAALLSDALFKSNWFHVAEREGIVNIMNERRIKNEIINNLKVSNRVNQGARLKHLIPAEYIISGGIISYDSNVKTGGWGASYFGAGPSGQYREDIVGIALRLIDAETGNVSDSITVNKRILSKQQDFGIFRFVKYKRLLEVEVGYTKNEPVQEIVKDAIQEGVAQLITSGIEKGYWKPDSVQQHKTDNPVGKFAYHNASYEYVKPDSLLD